MRPDSSGQPAVPRTLKDGKDGKDGNEGPHPSRFPHPLALLVACVLLAAALTWVLPAGRYERREDQATGRSVVVPGTYQRVEQHPVGPFQALVAIPKGIVDAASVIGLIFLIGGAFTVVERTGTFIRLVHGLVRRMRRRGILVIPVASVAFSLGGIMMQMQEELIAFVPVLLLLVRQLGFTPVTAVAMSLGAASVGAAFSPVNPFQVVIAQKVAELPPASGLGFRLAFLLPALGFWILGTMYYAKRTRVPRNTSGVEERVPLDRRDVTILLAILAAFAIYIYGAQRLGWEFNELAALFFAVGVLAGLLGRLGLAGTTDAFVDGFRSMTLAALLVGFARAIYVVLNEGQIVDTIVHGLFTPIAQFPTTLAAMGMMVVQAVHPCTGPEHQQPGGAHLAAAGSTFRPDRPVPPGHGPGLPVWRRLVRDRHPDEWRADGNVGGGGSALRGLAQVHDSHVRRAHGYWRRSRWPWGWR